ncbi:MAG: hypothetical protein HQL77_00925 [Magnetococcales bacterium]|nr:hypothetical protein [Magnetococcales bacterium]
MLASMTPGTWIFILIVALIVIKVNWDSHLLRKRALGAAVAGPGEQAIAELEEEVPLAFQGIPHHHLIAVFAAAQSVITGRVVRIDEASMDKNWTAIGRSLHQTSHDTRR